MKDDLISRQAAIDKFEPWLKVSGYSEGELNMLKAILYELRFMPSVQPEIVRCKDCKWKQGAECVRFADVRPFADDFCSRAERRTDG
jgi:hypothetical protein